MGFWGSFSYKNFSYKKRVSGNYADGSNISFGGSIKENLKKLLLLYLKTLTDWFYDNYTITNPDKWRFMCLGKNNNVGGTLNFNEFNLKNSDKMKSHWLSKSN